MSEVDRLSNSGLYPALPIADKRSRERPPGSSEQRHGANDKNGNNTDHAADQRRPPKSIIDDYA